jgi:hypothetical protein
LVFEKLGRQTGALIEKLQLPDLTTHAELIFLTVGTVLGEV